MRSNVENGFGLGEPEMDANTALTELDKGMKISPIKLTKRGPESEFLDLT